MAVYTEVGDDELEQYLTRYNIGELHALKGIAGGVENSNYLLTTDDGAFILTLYEKRVREQDLPFFLGLMEHLAGKGINCPRPVAMRDGVTLGRLAGRPCAVITFLDGHEVRRPTPFHCREVGVMMAQLHLAAEGFSQKRANNLAIADWRPLFERSQKHADDVAPGLAAMIGGELDLLEANWPPDQPEGIIHADLFTDNVFFLKNRLSGIIDFYFACNDILAYDLAIGLNAWCFESDLSFNTTKARALVDGYESVRPLTAGEFDALPILARGAALRFLLTRLYDWLNVPAGALVTPKDPADYIARLKFHQGIERAELYGLRADDNHEARQPWTA